MIQHQLGLRWDDACARLIKALPNHCYVGLHATFFPVLLRHRLTGFVPKRLRYPHEGIPPIQHQTEVRTTFVDATIENYLPRVEQFVELGAGYDMTFQLIDDNLHFQEVVIFTDRSGRPNQIRNLVLKKLK